MGAIFRPKDLSNKYRKIISNDAVKDLGPDTKESTRDIQDKVTRFEIGIDAVVFVPERLFCFGARCRARDNEGSIVSFAQFVRCSVLVGELKKRLIFFLC